MELAATFGIAVGLAMDSLAVSLCISTAGQAKTPAQRLRVAFSFGFFQGFMTLLGWFAGSKIAFLIENFDHWIAFILLAYIGTKMILSGLKPPECSCTHEDYTSGKTLFMLSIATSIDALAVGLSMALIGDPVVIPALIIGITSFVLSGMALLTGNRLGTMFGKKMEVIGGAILIAIGIRILITHLFL